MNREFANKVAEHIEQHPDQHNQGMWIWMVREENDWQVEEACTLGRAALLAGWAPDMSGLDDLSWVDGESASTEHVSRGGPEETVFSVAQDALGISRSDATWLFYSKRTTEEILTFLRTGEKTFLCPCGCEGYVDEDDVY